MAGPSFLFNNPRVERIVSGPGSIAKLPEEIDYSIHTNPKPVTVAEQVLEVLEQAW
jgi:hypothetical protein